MRKPRLKWALAIIALLAVAALGLWWLFGPGDDGSLAAIRRRERCGWGWMPASRPSRLSTRRGRLRASTRNWPKLLQPIWACGWNGEHRL